MKFIYSLTIISIFFLIPCTLVAKLFCRSSWHPVRCVKVVKRCDYYYGYNFASASYDYEVDNACVDFCLDKKHHLQECIHACSNYTPALDYLRCRP